MIFYLKFIDVNDVKNAHSKLYKVKVRGQKNKLSVLHTEFPN